ncbi:unnamed protein product [Owenia fusiformis]|uniref:Uncharacterized protein n=1 Tax=Owenia fusiformis TaxID=6347 RepID=A0A8J1U7H1_OWEFU|nr:unnamed protein product [Owenia fusiformis]
MARNSPSPMYKLKPYYAPNDTLPVSQCMYKLPSYYKTEKEADTSGKEMNMGDPLVSLEERQEAILQRLDNLKAEVEKLTQQKSAVSSSSSSVTGTTTSLPNNLGDGLLDVVISASPENPPLSLFVLHQFLSKQYSVIAKSHIHSSVKGVPENLCTIFHNGGSGARMDHQIGLTLMWKNVPLGPTMMVSANTQSPVHGEANIARYMARLLNQLYENLDITMVTEIDNWIEQSNKQLINGSSKEKAAMMRSLNSHLGRSDWLVGSDVSLADICVWAALQQTKQGDSAPSNVKKWLKVCNDRNEFKTVLSHL